MSVEIRLISESEVDAFRDCVFTTFGDDAENDPDGAARFRALVAPGCRWAALDGKLVVGTAATFDLAIGTPGGGTLPMAGLTQVTVRPRHRRRGILRELMKRHLDDARTRGYAISGLWASDAAIYGRFGYGISAVSDALAIADATQIEPLHRSGSSDSIEWIDEATAREQLPEVYAKATRSRPGALRRDATWWRERRFQEAPLFRGGASRRRHVIARRDGEITGYLQYRQKDGMSLHGRLVLIELIGIDARATLSLWELALRVDLFSNVSWSNAPVDEPLAWAVVDPRRIERKRTDTLWLRIEDVPTTLAARTYSADGTLRFASHGATWELVVDNGRGHCVQTSKAADLELGETGLASLFLGGVSATQLVSADRVRGEPGVVARADRMFASAIAPWCPEVF